MAHRNMATFIAATNLTELLHRMGADVPHELFLKHRFAIEVARAIDGGMLNGQGSLDMVGYMTDAYGEIMAAYWEACEERHKLNQAFQAQQAAATEEPKPGSLDEVLAGRAPRYRGGDVVAIRNEKWDNTLRAVVQRADWRAEGIDNWVYTVRLEGGETGTYAIVEDDPCWDIDFATSK